MPRDPERITRITVLIQKLWTKYPDARFFQFIEWVENEYSKQHDNFGKLSLAEKDKNGIEVPHNVIDLFYVEDERLERFLIKLLEENN